MSDLFLVVFLFCFVFFCFLSLLFCADEDVGSFQLLATIQAQVESREKMAAKKEEGEEKRAPFYDAFSHLNLVRLSPLFCNVKTVGNSPEWDAKRERERELEKDTLHV